tara:strand:- start:840 stop:2024 length:1185 start_codon:yes stop_codon:yes gene_type:complete
MSKVTLTESQINEIVFEETIFALLEQKAEGFLDPDRAIRIKEFKSELKNIKENNILIENESSDLLTTLNLVVDVVGGLFGFVPFYGDIVDLLLAFKDLLMRDYIGAGLGVLAAIPFLGSAAGSALVAKRVGGGGLAFSQALGQLRFAMGAKAEAGLAGKAMKVVGMTDNTKDAKKIYRAFVTASLEKKNKFLKSEELHDAAKMALRLPYSGRAFSFILGRIPVVRGLAKKIETADDMINALDAIMDFWFDSLFAKTYQLVLALTQVTQVAAMFSESGENFALWYDTTNQKIHDYIFNNGKLSDISVESITGKSADKLRGKEALIKTITSPPPARRVEMDGRALKDVAKEEGISLIALLRANGIEPPRGGATEEFNQKMRDLQRSETIIVPSRKE